MNEGTRGRWGERDGHAVERVMEMAPDMMRGARQKFGVSHTESDAALANRHHVCR